jgi:hypothetical protein
MTVLVRIRSMITAALLINAAVVVSASTPVDTSSKVSVALADIKPLLGDG